MATEALLRLFFHFMESVASARPCSTNVTAPSTDPEGRKFHIHTFVQYGQHYFHTRPSHTFVVFHQEYACKLYYRTGLNKDI